MNCFRKALEILYIICTKNDRGISSVEFNAKIPCSSTCRKKSCTAAAPCSSKLLKTKHPTFWDCLCLVKFRK